MGYRDATFPILIGNPIFKNFYLDFFLEESKREAINNFCFILIDRSCSVDF